MALNQTSLRNALKTLFETPPAAAEPSTLATRAAAAAAGWASVYRAYAAAAQSCLLASPSGPSLTAAEATLTATLTTAFQGTNPATLASGVAAAFTAFWLTPPVAFGAGAVVAVGGTGALQTALTGLWTVSPPPSKTPLQAADDHAALLHAFTLTVAAAHPPTCSGPIT